MQNHIPLSRPVLAIFAAAAAAVLPNPALAAITVGASGAFIDGPEASAKPARAAVKAPARASIVLAGKRETNLRKAATHVAVIGATENPAGS